jgi:multidrug resistance efflux pump
MAPKAAIQAQKTPQASVEPVTVSEETPAEVGERASGLADARTRMLLLGCLLFLLVGGIVAWRYYAVRETTDDAQIDGDIYTIRAYPVVSASPNMLG